MFERVSVRWSPHWTRGVLFWGLLAGFLAVLAIGLIVEFHGYQVWDDAYIFGRYAGNFLGSGGLVWNPGGAPTYGLTSPAFLLIVVPVHWLLADSPALVALISSALPGIVFVGLLLRFVWATTEGNRSVRALCVLLAAYSLAANAHGFAYLLTSGMETPFVLAYVTLFLWAAVVQERRPTTRRAVALGLLAGLSFTVRPDLLVYTLGLPLVMATLGKDARLCRASRLTLAVAVGFVAATLVATKAYFGVALPLAFFVKSTRFYGDHVYEMFGATSFLELALFVGSYRFLAIVVGMQALVMPRLWWRQSSSVEKGLLVCSLAFASYYLFFVLQIMGHNSRFYYPMLPALAWLAAAGVQRMMVPVLESRTGRLLDRHRRVVIVPALLVLASLYPSLQAVQRRHRDVRLIADAVGRFDLVELYRHMPDPPWFRLDAFSALPDDLVIATTEVGMPGVLNPGKTIIDLAGINDTEIVKEGFDPERFFARHKPDLLYMFHPGYRDLIWRLEDDRTFQLEYEYFPPASGTGLMGVALYRHSKYYSRMASLVRGAIDRQSAQAE